MNKKFIMISFMIVIIVILSLLVWILLFDKEKNTSPSKLDHEELEIDNRNEEKSMKIIIDNKEYPVLLDNNQTVNDILKMLPLELTFVRYAEHEYYSSLPSRPSGKEEKTSKLKAGHIYYWDGSNSFVINYANYDISPFESVHIGEIEDTSILDYLKEADHTIKVTIE